MQVMKRVATSLFVCALQRLSWFLVEIMPHIERLLMMRPLDRRLAAILTHRLGTIQKLGRAALLEVSGRSTDFTELAKRTIDNFSVSTFHVSYRTSTLKIGSPGTPRTLHLEQSLERLSLGSSLLCGNDDVRSLVAKDLAKM